VWAQERRELENTALQEAQALQAGIQARILRLEDRIRSLSAFMAGMGGYDPRELARYDSIVSPDDAVPWRAMAVAPFLDRRDLSEVESRVRAAAPVYETLGYPAFEVFPAESDYPEFIPIVAAESAGGRERIFGFDMASEPGRRASALQAVETGLVELSPAVNLSQDDRGAPPSLLLISSFRRREGLPGPFGDTVGIVAASFTPESLVREALTQLGQMEAVLRVTILRGGAEVLAFPVNARAGAGGDAEAGPADGAGDSPEVMNTSVLVEAVGDTHEWRIQGVLRAPRTPGLNVWASFLSGLVVTLLILFVYLRELGANARMRRELARQREDLRKSEERTAALRRTEALGQLTGGIAHDFNNLLSVIVGNLDMYRMADRSDPERDAMLDQMERAAGRAAALTQSLLTFGRQAVLAPADVEVGRLLEDLGPLLRTSVPESISLHMEYPEEPLPCQVDRTQLESAILNLVVNARDACADGDTVRVSARFATGSEAPGGLPRAVLIRVEDTGSGMPPEVLRRATDPFFTTKPTGRGTGLGLSTVVGFVRQSGGEVDIRSREGDGTTVDIWLPAREGADAGPEPAEGRSPTNAGIPATLPPGLRILLVEDEPAVRAVLRRALEGAGARVTEMDRADDAIAILAGGAEHDAVVSDVVMPGGKSGVDVALQARARRIPVILLSGYTSGKGEDQIREAADAFLPKPVSVEALLQTLARVLSDRSSTPGKAAGITRT
jgi:signal transduction histidine kinase/CheY-like chemotaxis protein